MDFRQYDNAIGRFNVIDPLTEQDFGNSPYAFAGNNPAMYSDPSGLKMVMQSGLPSRNKSLAEITDEIVNSHEEIGGGGGGGAFGNGIAYTQFLQQQMWGPNFSIGSDGFIHELTTNYKTGESGYWNRVWQRGDDQKTYDAETKLPNGVTQLSDVIINGRWTNVWVSYNSPGFNGYNYSDGLGQVTNALTVVWGATQLGVDRLRQVNLASSVGEVFGIGTQVAAPRLKAFTNLLRTWGNRVGVAGYALSALSIGSKLYNGEHISTAEGVGFGVNTAFLVAGSFVAGTAAAPFVAAAALIYGAAELGSYIFTGQTLEDHIFKP